MNRFHISRRLAVIVAGLGGVLLGLSAAAVPAAAARMVPLGDPHGRPVLAIPRPEPPGRNQPGSLRAAPGSELTLAQAPAGLRAAVRRSLGVPAASASSAGRQAELTAADGAPGDIFGFSVALSGRTAVVGAPFKNSNNGAAYVFVRSGTTWARQAKLTGPVGSFGYSAALSGATLVMGSPTENSFAGAAYVFTRSGNTWSQRAKLTAADGAADDFFGNSVALSGATAVAGAPGKNANAGAAYVFTRSGTTWSQQAKLTAAHGAANDGLGNSVALSGATALAGAPFKNASAGAAYVFRKV